MLESRFEFFVKYDPAGVSSPFSFCMLYTSVLQGAARNQSFPTVCRRQSIFILNKVSGGG
jgi:hypothetical protein